MNIEPKELTAIFFLTNDEMRNRYIGELEKRDALIEEQKEIMRVLTEELVALKKRDTAKRRRS